MVFTGHSYRAVTALFPNGALWKHLFAPTPTFTLSIRRRCTSRLWSGGCSKMFPLLGAAEATAAVAAAARSSDSGRSKGGRRGKKKKKKKRRRAHDVVNE